MSEKGWIHRDAFADDALTADTVGRAAMQDEFVTNTKIEDSTITAAKFAARATEAGYYGIHHYGRCYYG